MHFDKNDTLTNTSFESSFYSENQGIHSKIQNNHKMKTIKLFIIAAILIATYSCGSDEEELTPEEPTLEEPTSEVTLPSSISLIDIPAGTFTMGGATKADDAPEHTVTISAFMMSEKEITNAEYLEFLNAALADGWVKVESQQTVDPCGSYTDDMVVGTGDAPNAGEVFLQLGETGGCTSDGHAEHIDNKCWIAFNESSTQFELLDSDKSEWPINWVKWYGAYAFTEYYGISLPSEAQWEYAASSGQSGVEYPTSTGLLDATLANYNGDTPGVLDEDGHSVNVGSYAPNPFGMYDMGGNVWEWCLDYYSDSFYQDGVTDPVNTSPGTDAKRIRRGGAWNYHASTLLVYSRESDFQNRGNNHFGFRVAKN